MDGGRYIAEGSFGCVFDPALRCADGRPLQKGFIGKVSEKTDAIIEKQAAMYLKTIPDFQTYFIPAEPKSFCRMAPLGKQVEKDIYKCKLIREQGSSGVWAFQLPWGGVSLSKVDLSNPNLNPAAFVERLLELGALLALHGYVHFDIHSSNILVDERTFLPRLIDFGFFFDAKTLSTETLLNKWREWSPQHPPEPPELTIFTGFRHSVSAAETVAAMLRQKAPLKDAETRLGLSRHAQARELMAFLRASESVKARDPVRFFKLYWPALDAFSIGDYLLGVIKKFQVVPRIANAPGWPATLRRMKLVARGLLRMSPLARLDCVEALALWNPDNTILQSSKAIAWLAAKERDRTAIQQEGV